MLKNSFSKLLIARAISLIGDSIFLLGLPLYIYHYTGSKSSFGLSFGLEMICYMIFSFIGGSLADNFNLKKLLISIDILRVFIITASAIILSAKFNLALCFVIILILSSLNAIYNISFEKLPISYLKGESLAKILSYYQSMNQATHLIGAPLAAFILGLSVNKSLFFYINALTFIFPIWALVSFPAVKTKKIGISLKGLIKQSIQGIRLIYQVPPIRITILLSIFLNIVLASYYANWAILYKAEYQLQTQYLGLPHMIGGIAFLITSLLIARKYGGKSSSYFPLLFTAQFIGLIAGVLTPWALSLGSIILITSLFSISSAMHALPSTLIRKDYCDEQNYGKVLGAAKMLSRICTPLSIAASVALIKWFSITQILFYFSLIAISLSLVPFINFIIWKSASRNR